MEKALKQPYVIDTTNMIMRTAWHAKYIDKRATKFRQSAIEIEMMLLNAHNSPNGSIKIDGSVGQNRNYVMQDRYSNRY